MIKPAPGEITGAVPPIVTLTVVLRLQQGWPLQEAVRFGVSAAAAAVMNPGTELYRREDAERLYELSCLVPT